MENQTARRLLLAGFAEGTRLSAGTPLGRAGWRLSAQDLGSVVAYAPQDFVGAMDAKADLRSASDRLVDSKTVRLEWIAKKPEARAAACARLSPQEAIALQPLDAAEVAALIKRGQEFLKSGDIASARLLLRRAANTGNAQAALALGATFDGTVLTELGVLGFTRDEDQARSWYRKAAEWGSTGGGTPPRCKLESAGEMRSVLTPRAGGARWCPASARSATAGTSANARAARPVRHRARRFQTAGNGIAGPASSIPRPKGRTARWPRPRRPSRSAGGGNGSRQAPIRYSGTPRIKPRAASSGPRAIPFEDELTRLCSAMKVSPRICHHGRKIASRMGPLVPRGTLTGHPCAGQLGARPESPPHLKATCELRKRHTGFDRRATRAGPKRASKRDQHAPTFSAGLVLIACSVDAGARSVHRHPADDTPPCRCASSGGKKGRRRSADRSAGLGCRRWAMSPAIRPANSRSSRRIPTSAAP